MTQNQPYIKRFLSPYARLHLSLLIIVVQEQPQQE